MRSAPAVIWPLLLGVSMCVGAEGQTAAPADSSPTPPTPVAAAPQAVTPTLEEAVRKSLSELRADVTGAYKEYSGSDLRTLESYLEALARIDLTLEYVPVGAKPSVGQTLTKRIKEKKLRDMFLACSLLTRVALTHINKERLDSEFARVTAERDSVKALLAGVYKSIIDIERGRASELKGKLDQENEKARKLREEMRAKLKELESALIKVRRDARGTIVSMSDLLFGFDKADLTTNLKTSLAKIAGILSVYKGWLVLVEGHTDNVGSGDYNVGLSERRAFNVRDFLIEQGIAKERLSAAGYGEKRPIASNSTREGRQKNRRVDLVIIEEKK